MNIYLPKPREEIDREKAMVEKKWKQVLLKNEYDQSEPATTVKKLFEILPKKAVQHFKENFLENAEIRNIICNLEKFDNVTRNDILTLCLGRIEKYYEEMVFKYKLIKITQAGESFGELALFKNNPRSTTIVADQMCQCLVLKKASYQQILSQTALTQNEKTAFFEKMFMPSQTRLNLLEFQYNFKEMTKPQGYRIFKQGDPLKHIYLIKIGEVLQSRSEKYAAKHSTIVNKSVMDFQPETDREIFSHESPSKPTFQKVIYSPNDFMDSKGEYGGPGGTLARGISSIHTINLMLFKDRDKQRNAEDGQKFSKSQGNAKQDHILFKRPILTKNYEGQKIKVQTDLAFLGEDDLQSNQACCTYTAKVVSSSAVIYRMEVSEIFKSKSLMKNLIKVMLLQGRVKENWRKERVANLEQVSHQIKEYVKEGCQSESKKEESLMDILRSDGEGKDEPVASGLQTLLAGHRGDNELDTLAVSKTAKVQAFKVQDKLFESGNEKKWNLEFVGCQTKEIIKKNKQKDRYGPVAPLPNPGSKHKRVNSLHSVVSQLKSPKQSEIPKKVNIHVQKRDAQKVKSGKQEALDFLRRRVRSLSPIRFEGLGENSSILDTDPKSHHSNTKPDRPKQSIYKSLTKFPNHKSLAGSFKNSKMKSLAHSKGILDDNLSSLQNKNPQDIFNINLKQDIYLKTSIKNSISSMNVYGYDKTRNKNYSGMKPGAFNFNETTTSGFNLNAGVDIRKISLAKATQLKPAYTELAGEKNNYSNAKLGQKLDALGSNGEAMDFNINGIIMNKTFEGGVSRLWVTSSSFYDEEKFKANTRVSKMIHRKSGPGQFKMVEKKVWNPDIMKQAQAPTVKRSAGGDPSKIIESVVNITNTKSIGRSRRRGLYNYASLHDDSVRKELTGADCGMKLLEGKGDTRRGSKQSMDWFKDEERWYQGRDSVSVDHKSKFYEEMGKIALGLGTKIVTKSEISIRVPLLPAMKDVDVLGYARRTSTVGLKVGSGKRIKKKKALAKVERLHFGIDIGEQEKPAQKNVPDDGGQQDTPEENVKSLTRPAQMEPQELIELKVEYCNPPEHVESGRVEQLEKGTADLKPVSNESLSQSGHEKLTILEKEPSPSLGQSPLSEVQEIQKYYNDLFSNHLSQDFIKMQHGVAKSRGEKTLGLIVRGATDKNFLSMTQKNFWARKSLRRSSISGYQPQTTETTTERKNSQSRGSLAKGSRFLDTSDAVKKKISARVHKNLSLCVMGNN